MNKFILTSAWGSNLFKCEREGGKEEAGRGWVGEPLGRH